MKLARRIPTGKHYIECPLEHWGLFHDCWLQDQTHPIPMPMGHQMFTHPLEYNVTVMEIPDDELIRAAHNVTAPSTPGRHRLFGWTETEVAKAEGKQP
jgi:hypothetical protein